MLSYFVNTSRNTEQLCYFVQTALVWSTSPFVRLDISKAENRYLILLPHQLCQCPYASHAQEHHPGHTLQIWPHQDYTSLKPPAVLWQSPAGSQQSLVQGYTALCCSACCSAGPWRPFAMLGVGQPSDL